MVLFNNSVRVKMQTSICEQIEGCKDEKHTKTWLTLRKSMENQLLNHTDSSVYVKNCVTPLLSVSYPDDPDIALHFMSSYLKMLDSAIDGVRCTHFTETLVKK
jgi:hypothetical protein